jgi:hypothetical protein
MNETTLTRAEYDAMKVKFPEWMRHTFNVQYFSLTWTCPGKNKLVVKTSKNDKFAELAVKREEIKNVEVQRN